MNNDYMNDEMEIDLIELLKDIISINLQSCG